jgi:O-antigen ligase
MPSRSPSRETAIGAPGTPAGGPLPWLTRVKELVLIGTAVGVPVVFFGTHDDLPFNITKLSLLVAGVSCALGLHIVQVSLGHRTRGLKDIWLPAAALTVPLLLSWTASPYKEWALFGQFSRFNGLLPYAAFSILGVLLVDAFCDRRERLAWGLAIVGGVVGAYAFVQSVGLDPLWQPGTDAGTPFPPSTIGHYNFAGGFLAISLPFAIYAWVRSGARRLGMGLTTAVVVGLIMTNSQGGWVAAAAGVLVTVGALVATQWPRAAIVLRLGTVALALAVIAGVAVSTVAARPPLGGTAKSRGLLWGTALQMGVDSPILGRGPAAYAVEGVRYRPLEYVLLEPNTTADDPHSVPLSFWANAGAAGAGGFILFLAWIVARGLRVARDDPLGGVFFAGCVAYLTQSLVSIDEPTLRAGLWVAVAGLALSSPRRIELPRAVSRPRSVVAGAAVAAVAIASVGIWYAFGLMSAHRDQIRGAELFDEGRPEAAHEHFDRATAFRFEPFYLARYASDLGAAALAAEAEGGALIERMRQVDAYLETFPDPNGYLNAARTLFYWGHYDPGAYDEALGILELVRPLDADNPAIDVRASEILIARGRVAEARATLEAWSRQLTGHLPTYWGALAVVRLVDGDAAGGRAALEHALEMSATECRVLIARGAFELFDHMEMSSQVSSGLGFNCPRGDFLYLEDLSERFVL